METLTGLLVNQPLNILLVAALFLVGFALLLTRMDSRPVKKTALTLCLHRRYPNMSREFGGLGKLERAHAWAVRQRALHDFTTVTRILLAAGFIPTGLVKLLGHRFTQVSTDDPIGLFFEVMYQTGLYWHFIGFCQIAAGSLLLWRRTATLGAILYFPTILNIFVITVSLGFRGTPIITGLMVLACLYLLCWDGDRLRTLLPVVGDDPHCWAGAQLKAETAGLLRFGWWGLTPCVLALFLSTRSFLSLRVALFTLVLPVVGTAIDLLFALRSWQQRRGDAARVSV